MSVASTSNSFPSEGAPEQNTATMNGPAPIAVYLYAGDQIIENVTMGYFYYQDSLGNTSHVTDAVGNPLERYTYSAFGTPTFYNAGGTQIAASVYGIRHLFQGQLWTQETGLNDYRNRVELPAMGVFLQPDPIGFKGDAANIYRFCNNNAVNRTDPTGLDAATGSTIADRMRLFYGDGGRGSLSELDHPKDGSVTMATQFQRNGEKSQWNETKAQAAARHQLARQSRLGEDSTGAIMNDPPYIREPVFGRPVYKNPNDSPSLRRIDHYEEPLPPGHSHILTHVHTRVGFDRDRHRLQDPSVLDFRAMKTTDAMYFTNKILSPHGQYQIYRTGEPTETRNNLYAP